MAFADIFYSSDQATTGKPHLDELFYLHIVFNTFQQQRQLDGSSMEDENEKISKRAEKVNCDNNGQKWWPFLGIASEQKLLWYNSGIKYA